MSSPAPAPDPGGWNVRSVDTPDPERGAAPSRLRRGVGPAVPSRGAVPDADIAALIAAAAADVAVGAGHPADLARVRRAVEHLITEEGNRA